MTRLLLAALLLTTTPPGFAQTEDTVELTTLHTELATPATRQMILKADNPDTAATVGTVLMTKAVCQAAIDAISVDDYKKPGHLPGCRHRHHPEHVLQVTGVYLAP